VRRIATGLLVVTLVACAIDAALEQVTPAIDLWWHLATGRHIVEHLEIPRYDVFSYTNEGARWFNHEWLSQVLFFTLFRLGGGTALAVFKILAVVSFVLVAAWLAWWRSASLLFSVAAAGAAAVLCRPFLDIRPDLFLFVGTMTVMAIVGAHRRGAPPAVLALLPAVIALWVNLHSSFIYGLGLIGLLAGTETAKAALGFSEDRLPPDRAWRLALAAAAAGLACLLNPERLGALAFPFAILKPEAAVWRDRIVEWAPPVLFREGALCPAFFGYFLVGEVILTLAVALIAPRRLDPSDTLPVVFTGLAALRSRRFIPLFALVSVPLVARNLAVVRSRFVPRPRGAPELHRPRGAVGASLLVLGALASVLARAAPEVRQMHAEGLFARMTDASFFPQDAVEFLRLNTLAGRLFHRYAWGGYLTFHLPERKVFIDGRGHTVYPAEFYREDLAVEFGSPAWSAVLDRYQVALVLWPSGARAAAGDRVALLRQLLQSASWRRIYDDGDAVIFAHVERGSAWIERYLAFQLLYPDVPRAQFFLGVAYLDGQQFERGRLHLVDLVRRFPSGASIVREAEEHALATARSGGLPAAWFAVGLFREVLGDGPGALQSYATAVERGIAEPDASYARAAVERLGTARP